MKLILILAMKCTRRFELYQLHVKLNLVSLGHCYSRILIDASLKPLVLSCRLENLKRPRALQLHEEISRISRLLHKNNAIHRIELCIIIPKNVVSHSRYDGSKVELRD